LAHAERDRHDPVRQKLQAIEDEKAQEAALQQAKNITISEAVDRWIASLRFKNELTGKIYGRAGKRIKDWAPSQGLEDLSSVTADMLDLWRGQWSLTAEDRANRLGPTAQSHFQDYLKRFFRCVVRVGFIERNPALELPSISHSKKRTQVLNAKQFKELLAAIEPFCAAQTSMLHDFSKEFRALFLLQRWSGLRIIDCIMLLRAGLTGNNLQTKAKKNGAKVDCLLPDEAVNALLDLSPDREKYLPEYFLWFPGITGENMGIRWAKAIHALNSHLAFKDSQGQPMKFHSHMLRDTFAVELLMAGVALEDVSRLLTHSSIKTTEDYYGHWVPDRLALLKRKSIEAMEKMGATFALQP
jgi:site-specific recombinase XerD